MGSRRRHRRLRAAALRGAAPLRQQHWRPDAQPDHPRRPVAQEVCRPRAGRARQSRRGQVEHRWSGHRRLTNLYRIRTSRPGGHSPPPACTTTYGPRGAARMQLPHVRSRGLPNSRGRVAARIRHDRESSTDTPPPPPPTPSGLARLAAASGAGRRPAHRPRRELGGPDPGIGSTERWRRRHEDLLVDCGVISSDAWDGVVAQVHAARQAAGQPLTRWSAAHLLTAVDLAIRGRGWPADRATNALLQVPADPSTRSPARLAEAGPWWDEPPIAGPNESVDVWHWKPNWTPSADYASSYSAPLAARAPRCPHHGDQSGRRAPP